VKISVKTTNNDDDCDDDDNDNVPPVAKTPGRIFSSRSWTADVFVLHRAPHTAARSAVVAAACQPAHHAAMHSPGTVYAPENAASASLTQCSAGAPPTKPSPEIQQSIRSFI